MKKRKYLEYIRNKYDHLSAQYLKELFQGKNIMLIKALSGVLNSLSREKQEYSNKHTITGKK
jgi:hypothetical protein